MTTPTIAPTIPADLRMVPVTLLRAGAALLGVYGYLVTLWLARHGSNPQPVAAVREWVNRPLGLGEDFGPVAVMVLLLCGGYTAAATGFAPRRLIGTYLPVLVATVLAACAVLAGLDVWTEPRAASVSWANVLGNLTFASHLLDGRTVLVPLAWVVGLQLVAELVALDRRTWPTVVVLLVGVGAACLFLSGHEQLGRPLLFLPMVLLGHVTWRVTGRNLPAWAGVLLGAGCFAAVAAADRAFDGLERWWYPVAATYAVLLFLVAVLVPGRTAAAVAASPVTRWLADRVEWLLLLGGVIGFAVLEALRGHVPVPLGMLVALAAVGLAAELGHRCRRIGSRS